MDPPPWTFELAAQPNLQRQSATVQNSKCPTSKLQIFKFPMSKLALVDKQCPNCHLQEIRLVDCQLQRAGNTELLDVGLSD